jgi:penicillin-binding protein 1B
MVVTNPETGEVQAMIGSRQASFAGFNRAIDAVRPIGSLVKPAVYLTALEQPSKYTLTSWLSDEPFSVKGADGQVWRRRTTTAAPTARSSCTRAWRIPTTCRPPSSAWKWACRM